MILTCCLPKVKCAPVIKTLALFLLWKNLPNKFSFHCVRGKGKREASQLGQKPHMLKAQYLLLCWVSPVQHQPPTLFSIYSLVVPQTGCWKRRKADRCCFSGFRVLGATGSMRFRYHRCFSTWAKMVRLQRETELHYGQRHEIRDGAVRASQSCYIELNKSMDWSCALHKNLGFILFSLSENWLNSILSP